MSSEYASEAPGKVSVNRSKNQSLQGIVPGNDFFVVGIGASAGGLEALERFFAQMPAETGMAFVVVQHLSPDFESLMDELLSHRTKIPIFRVTDGMMVQPDSVFLIPPKKEMIVSAGKLLLTDKDPSQGLTLPIDQFFRSLSQDIGPRAIGIVLSGTGSDGSRGVRDIHEAGGFVIAQSDDSAKFDGMPRSAVETGVVDLVLPPEEMPGALLRHIQHPLSELHSPPAPEKSAREEGMNAILTLLRQEYGIDFSHYKPNTVLRRTERRLSLNQSLDLEDYVNQLRNDANELNSLYRDLLIGVTSFFRDVEAYEQLGREAIGSLLTRTKPQADLRIWVAGCATGEEAYSIAMLVHEQLEQLGQTRDVKIFATDVHRASIDVASIGVYSEASLAQVSTARRDRYFTRQGNGFHVSQELRQMIVFATHNIIKDAPFTRLDLITCRNLLIYLQPLAQKKVLSLFHFGLKAGGHLFLGPSESPAELADEFDCLHEHWKIYRKRRDIRLPADMRLPLSVGTTYQRATLVPLPPKMGQLPDAQLVGAYDALLEAFIPPSLLVNEFRELLHTFGGAEKFLRLKSGRPSADLLDLVHPELRTALAGALQTATKGRTQVVFQGVPIVTQDGKHHIRLAVHPIHNRASNGLCMLISFEDMNVSPVDVEETELHVDDISKDRIISLETELRYTKENLQATIEELETSNEELQATNEELVASNEELQSTNEELHSVNEELYTVNAEYQRKISELTELTNDMDNLLHSTEIATIFLDRNLCIRKFTSRSAQLFDLLPHDLGRHIDTFSHRIQDDQLIQDTVDVMTNEQPVEREVRDRHGNWLFLRILPYRSKNAVEGTVLTLIDISALKQAEARLSEMDLQLQGILDNSTAMIFVKDLEGRYLLANRQCHLKLGAPSALVLGRTDRDFLPREVADAIQANDRQVAQRGEPHEFEETVPGPGGARTFLSIKFPLRDDAGQIQAVGVIATDISRHKQVEQEQREAVRRRDQFLAMLSHELRNPLGAILNAICVMERENAGAAMSESCHVVSRQGQQMARLLDDLLDVSRITQNKIDIRKQVLDLRTTVEDAVQSVQPMIEQRQQVLSVQVTDRPLFVEGDPSRLQQIQVNLLNNAAKYTPPGEQVWLTLENDQGQAVIRVRDNGVGIEPQMLEGVFDLFVQGHDSLDRSCGGMGVGLTLVRSIVELHGGQVRAYSAGPGSGSEFVVRLPLTSAPPPVATNSQPSTPPRKLTVLIVEDNRDSREMLRAMLELDGHQVLTAADGREGLSVLEQQLPDLAIIDIGLPLLNGYDLARQARANDRLDSVLIVALTGYGQRVDQEQALRAGFDEHLTKPLQPADLARILTAAATPRPAGKGADPQEAAGSAPWQTL